MFRLDESVVKRLLKNIHTTTLYDCWEWVGSPNFYGYGEIRISGKTYKAHRIAYQFFYEDDDIDDKVVMHICDNPKCCNPLHLKLGTQLDNINDMCSKHRNRGRGYPGEDCGKHKLSNKQVLEIRNKYKTGLFSQRMLAKEYKVSQPNIKDILKRRTWKHI